MVRTTRTWVCKLHFVLKTSLTCWVIRAPQPVGVSKMQDMQICGGFLILSIESIGCIACTRVIHCEHQIRKTGLKQLWKYWIVGRQWIHYAAVTSKVYLHLSCKDCVEVARLRACSWISLEIRNNKPRGPRPVYKQRVDNLKPKKVLDFGCKQHFQYFLSQIKRPCLLVRLQHTNLIKRIAECLVCVPVNT